MSARSYISYALLGFALSVLCIFTVDYSLAPKAVALGEGHERLWGMITNMGDATYMLLIVIAIWVYAFVGSNRSPGTARWAGLRAKAIGVLASVAGTGIFIMIVKVMVGRARPYTGELGFSPFTFGSAHASWPSGHTTTAFAFAVAMGLAFPKLRWPLLALAALTGFSRMVLNMHYLGDVIMGATIGTLGAMLIYNGLRPKLGLKG